MIRLERKLPAIKILEKKEKKIKLLSVASTPSPPLPTGWQLKFNASSSTRGCLLAWEKGVGLGLGINLYIVL